MMTHNSIQSKVGPQTRRSSLFPGAKTAPKTTPNSLPKHPAPKKKAANPEPPKYYDPRDKLPEHAVQGSYIQRRRPDLFLLIVGVVFLGLGVGLTWYGAETNLTDFLIIGPGCLVIGVGMVTIALVMICRDIRRKRKQSKVTIDVKVAQHEYQDHDDTRSTIPDYLMPVGLPISGDIGITREPTDGELYGEGNSKDKHKHDKNTTEPPNLAKPVYHEQESEQETKVEVYHVPLPVVTEVTQNDQAVLHHEERLKQNETDTKNPRVLSASSYKTLDSSTSPYDLGGLSDEEALMRELTDMELYGERCSTTLTVLTDAQETPAIVHPDIHVTPPGVVQ